MPKNWALVDAFTIALFRLRTVHETAADVWPDRKRGHALGELAWYVLIHKDRLLGWVVLHLSDHKYGGNHAQIEDLFVCRKSRNKGWGTLMLDYCENVARKAGKKHMWLAVNPEHNKSARRLYERLGYRNKGLGPYLDGVYDGFEDWVIDLEKKL